MSALEAFANPAIASREQEEVDLYCSGVLSYGFEKCTDGSSIRTSGFHIAEMFQRSFPYDGKIRSMYVAIGRAETDQKNWKDGDDAVLSADEVVFFAALQDTTPSIETVANGDFAQRMKPDVFARWSDIENETAPAHAFNLVKAGESPASRRSVEENISGFSYD